MVIAVLFRQSQVVRTLQDLERTVRAAVVKPMGQLGLESCEAETALLATYVPHISRELLAVSSCSP